MYIDIFAELYYNSTHQVINHYLTILKGDITMTEKENEEVFEEIVSLLVELGFVELIDND